MLELYCEIKTDVMSHTINWQNKWKALPRIELYTKNNTQGKKRKERSDEVEINLMVRNNVLCDFFWPIIDSNLIVLGSTKNVLKQKTFRHSCQSLSYEFWSNGFLWSFDKAEKFNIPGPFKVLVQSLLITSW